MTRPADKTGLAIVLSLLALVLFDAMGLIIKHLSDRYSAAELSVWRNLFGLLPALIALYFTAAWHRTGRPILVRQWRLALLRGGLVTFAQLCFYLSLGRMEFATSTTITYANALFVTAMAGPLLGERVGWMRWCAVMVGFCGVILVMEPGHDAFQTDALLPLGAAVFYAFAAVTARLFDSDVPTPLFNLYSSVASCFGAVCIASFFDGFTPIGSLQDLAWICSMGCFGGMAVLLLVVSYRMTEPSNLGPFSYFGIPVAFVLVWFFYDETPWSALWPGGVLIGAGGLIIVWRERKARARA